MVLALPLYDVYRESILRFAREKALGGKRIALVNPTLVSMGFSVLPGFAPAGEALLFRQKSPKPLTPRLASTGGDGRQLEEGGPTRSAQTRPAR
jgi:hypothetical protein